jgi:uncharacterized protein (TIGR03086 family)
VNEIAERYRRVASQFTSRVDAVPEEGWDRVSPCEGWLARDVVGHLVEWLPAFFFGTWDLGAPVSPSVDEDPAGAWRVLDTTIQSALDDPSIADQTRETRMGNTTFAQAIDMICTPDVLIHTWDLARAVGLDETLDADEVHRFASTMEPLDQMLRESGHYGPRVPVAADADEQTQLLAFLGRRP